MIYREPPCCIFCGKVIAEAVYHQQPKDTPLMELFIGDSFVRWEYIEHDDTKCAKRYFRKQKLEKINKHGN